MDQHEKAYRKLQQHLNRQAVGFPATRSGAEIKLLKHIFSPKDAEVAACLDYRPEPLDTIFGRVKHMFKSPGELEVALDRIHQSGGIHAHKHNGRRLYSNIPLIIGMYESQTSRMSSEFVDDFNQYSLDRKFGLEFLSTDIPQMRTIPVSISIASRPATRTFDSVMGLIENADPPIAVLECICRQKKAMQGEPCEVTSRKETCLDFGEMAQSFLTSGRGREIDQQEAVAIIEQNQKDGLLLQVSNTKKAFHICSCCGCCCGFLEVLKKLPKPLEFWSSNFHSTVDENACDGCGVCSKRCQMGAITLASQGESAVVDRNLCIGCGLCVPACQKQAIHLESNAAPQSPPDTRQDLYDAIMARKKGQWGKLKLTGKLFVDAVRTGRMDLLK